VLNASCQVWSPFGKTRSVAARADRRPGWGQAGAAGNAHWQLTTADPADATKRPSCAVIRKERDRRFRRSRGGVLAHSPRTGCGNRTRRYRRRAGRAPLKALRSKRGGRSIAHQPISEEARLQEVWRIFEDFEARAPTVPREISSEKLRGDRRHAFAFASLAARRGRSGAGERALCHKEYSGRINAREFERRSAGGWPSASLQFVENRSRAPRMPESTTRRFVTSLTVFREMRREASALVGAVGVEPPQHEIAWFQPREV